MAYIDVDKFAEKICNFQAIDEDAANKMIWLLRTFPTADVVPKSESEFDSIPVEAAQALKEKAVEKAKAEVAREIFEEIEKIIDKHHSECYEYEDGDECDTAITYISYISYDISELKKKYTEGEKE